MKIVVSVFLSVLILFVACKVRNDSKLAHEIASLSRIAPNQLANCHDLDRKKYFRNYKLVDSAASQDYIQKIFAHITANNPSVFTGDYAPNFFCFYIVESSAINAFALADSREIFFHSGLLKKVPSDAAFAGVLAHELVHITLQHFVKAIHPDLKGNTAYLAADDLYQNEKLKIAEVSSDDRVYTSTQLQKLVLQLRLSLPQGQLQSLSDISFTVGNLLRDIEATPNWRTESKYLALYRKLNNFEYLIYLRGRFGRQSKDQPDVIKNTLDAIDASFDEISDELNTLENHFESCCSEDLIAVKALSQDQAQAQRLYRQKLSDVFYTVRETFDRRVAVANKILGENVFYNWLEQEADEAGFELYLRAKFVPEDYLWVSQHILASPEAKTHLGAFTVPEFGLQQERSDSPFARGTASHPTALWRLQNIRQLEWTKHEGVYNKLAAEATIKDQWEVERKKMIEDLNK